jgi:hypothetical protein
VLVALRLPDYEIECIRTPSALSRDFFNISCTPPPHDDKVLLMALTKEAREYFAKEGRRGGKAYVKNSTPEERKQAASKAAKARWSKAKKEKKA